MKDIDFDELDRAVNSVIGSTPSETAAESTPTSAAEESTSVAVSVSSGSTQTEDTPTQVPAAASTPLAARRSSGRFMDVVHPSSDMRSASDSSPTPTVQVAKEDTSTASNEITPVAPETSPESWPDPIDVAQESAAEDATQDTPLESPFLADAKVEKRPLGAFSTDTSDEDEVVEQKTEDTQTDEHPIQTDVPMPAELQNDLLSVELGGDVPAVEETPAAPVSIVTPPVVAETTGPTSINQQYSEQPSTSEQPAPVIFNTDAYKQPLAHPNKKKSGWLVVLWIFLLLVVGAGIGALVYYQVLPLL